jgi:RNA polymerase sigma-70 factor, ECF subfamily
MLFDPRPTLVPPASAPPEATDAALLQRAAAGEATALSALYRRHGAAVFRYAWLLTGSEATAADIVQDTFIKLLDHAGGFDPARGSCAGYLCGIARHLALRQRRTRVDFVDDTDTLAESVAHDELPPLPADRAERAQAIAQLHAAIRALPPHYRDVLILIELQELSYAEVAAIVGIELGTVRSRLARARARLLELLGDELAIGSRRLPAQDRQHEIQVLEVGIGRGKTPTGT